MWWLILAVSCVLAFVLFSCSLIPYRRTPNTNIELTPEENIEPDYAMINDVLNRNVIINTELETDDAVSMVSSVARLRTNDEEGYMKIKISYYQKRGAIRKSHVQGKFSVENFSSLFIVTVRRSTDSAENGPLEVFI